MVNITNVHGSLTQDTAALPPAAMHRAYSEPEQASPSGDKEGTYTSDAIYPDKNLDVSVDKYDGAPEPDVPGEDVYEDRERTQKVARTAGYLNTFFLITTDVLGPSVAPWAISILGFVPGALVFFFLGVVATYTALILLNLFVKLDTPEQPIRTFADIAERIAAHWGPGMALFVRHGVSILQAIQQLMTAAVLIFGSAIIFSQLVDFNICFVTCLAIFGIIFNVGGLIKQFRHLGYFANMSVWLNLSVCFVCMGVAGSAVDLDGSVTGTVGGIIHDTSSTTQVWGNQPFELCTLAISNIIYAYGGAAMYVELMSEMRNPREFWKSLFMAEFIIIGMYFLFGLYFYSQMGIYTNNIPQANITNLTANKYCNVIGIVTGIVAGVMYGNVALKVIYYQLVVDILKGPQLNTKKGTYLWLGMSVLMWWVAFIIAGAVPNLQSIVGLVGALCIMQFSYTFPPLMQFFYYWSQGTTLKEKLTDKWALKAFDMVIALGSLAATGLGMWGSIQGMITSFQAGSVNGFGCVNPQYGV